VGTVITAGRTVRVMVPVAAVLLAAVVTWSQADAPAVISDLTAERARASRAHWQEQMSPAAVVEQPRRAADNIEPSPSRHLPLPSGEIRYPETLASVKVFILQVPGVGGIFK
jgi:hypothetical protein